MAPEERPWFCRPAMAVGAALGTFVEDRAGTVVDGSGVDEKEVKLVVSRVVVDVINVVIGVENDVVVNVNDDEADEVSVVDDSVDDVSDEVVDSDVVSVGVLVTPT